MKILALLLTAGLLGSAHAAQPAPAQVKDDAIVAQNGMTLYTFDKDEAGSGKSACNGPCAAKWPPFVAASDDASDATAWAVIKRDDGSRQWTYKGKPVYFWVGDQKAGDRTGDGVGGVWHIARP